MKVTCISASLPAQADLSVVDVALTFRDSEGKAVTPDGLATSQVMLWFMESGGCKIYGAGHSLRFHADDPEAALLRSLFCPPEVPGHGTIESK